MPKRKQYVYSSRTTEEGLKLLNDLKARLGVSWDLLITDAVCAHYGLDRDTLMLPASVKPRLTDEERKVHRKESSAKHKAKKKAGTTNRRGKAKRAREPKAADTEAAERQQAEENGRS